MNGIVSALVIMALVASSAFAQDGASIGRLVGSVEDSGGHRINGAEVVLESVNEGGRRTALSDGEGDWSVSGLPVGAWRIAIRAEGFKVAEGQIRVSGRVEPLRVALRSFAEISPGGWEGNPQTVKNWLETGNSLLEQGHSKLAREELEKALQILPEESRPEVLRVIARTHFVEKNEDGAILALQLAMAYGPRDDETRRLLEAVGESLGRQAEVQAFLVRVEDGGAAELLEELRPAAQLPRSFSPTESEMRNPEKHQVGRFQTRFEARSPLGLRREILLRHEIDEKVLGPTGVAYDLSDETFEIYVPASYSPEGGAGLFVWVSPLDWGGFTREAIREALDREGMIWIGANRSGNRRLRWDRISLALDAVHNMSELYSLDEDRIYVGGYSGGGRTASALTVLYPEVFRGGFFFMGVDFYRDVPALDRPGAHWPAAFPRPPKERFELARDRSRYVLLTGELDFNRIQTRELYERYRADGFRHVTLLDVPGLSHYSGFDGVLLDQGFEALKGGS